MNRIAVLAFAACSAFAQTEVVTTGLQNAQRLVLTPGGNFLVSEGNASPNSGRISYVTRGGVRRSLFEALPSGQDVQGGASGPTGLALRGRTLYMAFGAGDNERPGPRPGQTVHNPAGASSRLHTAVLTATFSGDVDTLAGTFMMTPDQQQAIADGEEVEMEDGAGGRARVSLLINIENSTPDPNSVYRFSNPFSLELTPDGSVLYVVDASQNTLLRVDTATGRSRVAMRFSSVRNPTPIGAPVIDPVPTSARLYFDQVLVSFLTGFPFAPGNARVLAVNPTERSAEPFIFGLNSAVDLLWRQRADGRSQFFVLEFSQNQSAQPAAPGRLLRFDGPAPDVLASDLRAPVSLAYDSSSEEMFILELTGRILRLPIR